MIKKFLLIITILTLLISCATYKDNISISTSILNGKTYKLVNMFDKNAITISFHNEEFYVYGGVNTYYGKYQMRIGNIILFNNITTTSVNTEMTEEAQIIEKEYLDVLMSVASIEFTSDGIKLITLDNTELVFKKLN